MPQRDRDPSIGELIEQLKNIRIQEARIIEQIERINNSSEDQTEETFVDYQIGDRIRITNGVRGTHTTTGTVTRVGDERISITLDDGKNTWRIRKNLTRWY